MLKDRNEALLLLEKLGAAPRLIHHARTVGETARTLSASIQSLGGTCDDRLIELGAVVHDAGKIQHPQELSQPGTRHEQAGKVLLLSHGVQPEIARFCVTHAQSRWDVFEALDSAFEEIVASGAEKLQLSRSH